MIEPQLTLGGCTPRLRNDSADSVRIVVAIISGSSTITVDTTLGRISEKISRRLPAPSAIAASTNSRLITESTWPRIGRYTYGRKMNAMRSVGTQRLDALTCSGPTWNPFEWVSSSVASEIASRYTGKAQMMSMTRDRIESVIPPKKPAMSAITVATTQQITAEPIPTSSELRPPYSSSAATSRPSPSAPRK